MHACDPTTTLAALVGSGLPLALSCNRCRRRAVIAHREIARFEGHYQHVCRLPLLCACGSKNVALHLFNVADDVDAFMSSDPRDARHA